MLLNYDGFYLLVEKLLEFGCELVVVALERFVGLFEGKSLKKGSGKSQIQNVEKSVLNLHEKFNQHVLLPKFIKSCPFTLIDFQNNLSNFESLLS